MPRKKKEETTTDGEKTTKKEVKTTTYSEYGFNALREKAKLNKASFSAKIR